MGNGGKHGESVFWGVYPSDRVYKDQIRNNFIFQITEEWKMIPDEVVHYTSREIAIEHILFEKKIRFGLLGMTNDPRETKTWSFPISWIKLNNPKSPNSTLMEEDFLESYKMNEEVNKIANQVMMEEWKVFCVSKHITNEQSDLNHASPTVDFNKGYCHPRLWANYAGRHTGVCLIFNGQKLDQIIHKTLIDNYHIFQGSVIYDNLHAIASFPIEVTEYKKRGIRTLVLEYFYQYYESCFLTKTKDWESENEYRWIIHSSAKEPIFIPIDGVLTSVLAGADFPLAYETTLKYFCKDLNIPAGKINWYNGQPRIEKESIYKP
jgi:hypothetical protein